MKLKTAILGASGYVGAELLRLSAAHPNIDIHIVTADSKAGMRVGELYPHLHLHPQSRLTFAPNSEATDLVKDCDVVFSALPHSEGISFLGELENELVIDLSSDYRLESTQDYQTWYGYEHSRSAELSLWTYGLTELFKEQICQARRIANPGCYATAAILALAPLVNNSLTQGTLIIDGLSGTSGAGRSAGDNLQFSHVYEGCRSYKIGIHPHTPEIEMALSRFSDEAVQVSFTPHLLPMSRGLQVTCSAELRPDATGIQIVDAFTEAYHHAPFVQFFMNGDIGTKEVRGSNNIFISAHLDQRLGRVVVCAVIDNLIKGAAGQAIQNMNIALGLDETMGLPLQALYP